VCFVAVVNTLSAECSSIDAVTSSRVFRKSSEILNSESTDIDCYVGNKAAALRVSCYNRSSTHPGYVSRGSRSARGVHFRSTASPPARRGRQTWHDGNCVLVLETD